MSIEIFEINENGAGWVSLEKASANTKLDLELAIITNAEMQMNCYWCHKPIPRGNACGLHSKNKGAIYLP